MGCEKCAGYSPSLLMFGPVAGTRKYPTYDPYRHNNTSNSPRSSPPAVRRSTIATSITSGIA